MLMVEVEPHPLLDVRVIVADFGEPIATLTSDKIVPMLDLSAAAPVQPDESTRQQVREMLRYSGFKPAGRSKPAAEYLVAAASQGRLRSINLAVDLCNMCSLHSGIPMSVVDWAQLELPLAIRVADEGSRYVFNASGQEIDLGGLLCLCDQKGPCANAIKDSQRTKTGPHTQTTLSILWGPNQQPEKMNLLERWYREALQEQGASLPKIAIQQA